MSQKTASTLISMILNAFLFILAVIQRLYLIHRQYYQLAVLKKYLALKKTMYNASKGFENTISIYFLAVMQRSQTPYPSYIVNTSLHCR